MTKVGQYGLNPFSSPHRPVNPMTAPDQLRGNDNSIAKNFTAHDADATIHISTVTTTGVGTSATAIYPAVVGLAAAFVSGVGTGGDTFVDQIAWNGTTNIVKTISSTTVDGSPSARLYTVASHVLKVQFASTGGYNVTVLPFALS